MHSAAALLRFSCVSCLSSEWDVSSQRSSVGSRRALGFQRVTTPLVNINQPPLTLHTLLSRLTSFQHTGCINYSALLRHTRALRGLQEPRSTLSLCVCVCLVETCWWSMNDSWVSSSGKNRARLLEEVQVYTGISWTCGSSFTTNTPALHKVD